MSLTIAAAGGLAGDQTHQHLEFLGHGALIENSAVELHEGTRDGRPALHGQNTVGYKAACLGVMLKPVLKLRMSVRWQR
jgi:hypothetical protein